MATTSTSPIIFAIYVYDTEKPENEEKFIHIHIETVQKQQNVRRKKAEVRFGKRAKIFKVEKIMT